MSIPFVLISLIFVVLALVIKMYKDDDSSIWECIKSFVAAYILFGFIALALSRPVTIVNGHSKDQCEQGRYLFFYTGTINSTREFVFLLPFSDDVVVNNTGKDIMVHPIACGDVEKEPSPIVIEKYSIAKVEDTPEYIFEPLPDIISYTTSRNSSESGVVKWAIIHPEEDKDYHGLYLRKWY